MPTGKQEYLHQYLVESRPPVHAHPAAVYPAPPLLAEVQPTDLLVPRTRLTWLRPCRESCQSIALGISHVCMHRATLVACTPPLSLILLNRAVPTRRKTAVV